MGTKIINVLLCLCTFNLFMAVLNHIELLSFRNISKLQLKFGRGVNVLFGANGQGKTNIIESIYFLTKGRSFRPGKNDSFIKKGEQKARLTALIEGQGQQDEVNLKFLDNKKNFEINRKKSSSVKISKSYSNVLFSPESLSVIKDEPEKRRLLVDDFLISHQASNASVISDYRKCVRYRNKVLRDFKQRLSSEGDCRDLLESLNPIFLKLATQLTVSRVNSLRDISPFMVKSFEKITKDKNVDISVDYLISSQTAISWEREQIYNAMRNSLFERESSELVTGLTLVGPHKHDVKFLYQKEDSRYFCSQGQQRSLILSFKMAQIMYHYTAYGEYPILLLDDVLSELDESKRRNLVEFLNGIHSQVFITMTDMGPSIDFRNQTKTFEVKSGGVVVY